VVEGVFAGARDVSLIFDTGAKLSYVRRELLAGMNPYREAEDFYPIYRRFKTPVYRATFELGGESQEADFGVLPTLLEAALFSGRADGIIGSELLINRTVVLAARRKRLSFGPRFNPAVTVGRSLLVH
jgi:hypothetical protein